VGRLVEELEAVFARTDAESRAAREETQARGDTPAWRVAAALEEEIDGLREALLIPCASG
jgi:hypothetical protein